MRLFIPVLTEILICIRLSMFELNAVQEFYSSANNYVWIILLFTNSIVLCVEILRSMKTY